LNVYVSARRITSDGSRPFDGYSTGNGVRPDGTFRLVLAPGEYQLDAHANPRLMNGPPRPEEEQFATAKVSVASGAEEAVSMTIGRGATATGRVIFEGTTPPPASPGKVRVPLFSEIGECRSGEATVAADWSFKIEGLAGTCSAPPSQMAGFGRWMLKAVMINGDDIASAPFTFQPDQQLRNVQIVVTDKRSDMLFHVSDESGQPTRDYVVVVFPVEKSKWAGGGRIFVGPPPDLVGGRGSSLSNLPGPIASGRPQRREAMPGLRPGEYYVVAVDDLEPDDSRDPTVLERLRSSAVRVNVSEGVDADVPLRRVNFADAMAKR
jgi:hypothetical protein